MMNPVGSESAGQHASLVHTDVMGDRVKYEGLSRLCDTLKDSKAVIEIEIHAVREWLLHACDILYIMSQAPHMHNSLRSNSDVRDRIAKRRCILVSRMNATSGKDLAVQVSNSGTPKWSAYRIFEGMVSWVKEPNKLTQRPFMACDDGRCAWSLEPRYIPCH